MHGNKVEGTAKRLSDYLQTIQYDIQFMEHRADDAVKFTVDVENAIDGLKANKTVGEFSHNLSSEEEKAQLSKVREIHEELVELMDNGIRADWAETEDDELDLYSVIYEMTKVLRNIENIN